MEAQTVQRSARFQQAVEMLGGTIETWRHRLASDQDKISSVNQAQPFFVDLVGVELRLGQPEQALVA